MIEASQVGADNAARSESAADHLEAILEEGLDVARKRRLVSGINRDRLADVAITGEGRIDKLIPDDRARESTRRLVERQPRPDDVDFVACRHVGSGREDQPRRAATCKRPRERIEFPGHRLSPSGSGTQPRTFVPEPLRHVASLR